MQRIVTRFLGLVLVAAVGLFAYTGASASDTPEIGGLTPLAPDAIQEPNSSPELFPNGEPVTPFVDDAIGPEIGGLTPLAPDGMQEPTSSPELFPNGEPVTPFVDDANGPAVGSGGDVGSGMAVPGYEGNVTEMVVETDN